MGCTSSIPKRYPMGKRKKKHISIHEVAVFVPAGRVPVAVDLIHPLTGLVPRDLIDKLSALRGRIVKCLPNDLQDGILESISSQALAQVA
ncbi:hypothetical protein B296_00029113 [Ensete ventricosum]|uniref:Uncharacterized protein n=1 Tax=Ensete ventricosum TaxID=4639 RepID=A0A426Z3Z7_ENSVE|nr:hypothetical protein B296_00029113 [Ensete ventricosum]